MKTYRIASIPGDGIGNEVIPAGIEVLQKTADGFRLEFEYFDWSSRRFQQTGQYIPDGGLEGILRRTLRLAAGTLVVGNMSPLRRP